ncbi:hypothetical protein V6N13_127070 [Hibiscus sabdariffa]
MGATVLGGYVQAWGLFLREGCSAGALGLEQGWISGGLSWFCSWLLPLLTLFFRRPFCLVVVGCLVVKFLSFRVSHLGNQAPLKLALVRRCLPSKFIWCLALAVNAFTTLGVNDNAFGAVVKSLVLDQISIQVYDIHSWP